MTETPVLLGGRYQLGEVIGRGGMAEVHLGRDLRLGRTVAVKILRADLARDPLFQARFRREAQSAAGLNHPSVVAVYDTGEDILGGSAVPFIVMEHVEGHTLRELLNSGRRLLPERALEMTAGVLVALDYSHRHGIIHRDIKPGNVMLTSAGDIKVMDFGIARAIADTAASMTQTAAVIGTAQYLSPEQARGEQVDARSDLYSTGCLLYELLTGRPPFVGDSPVAVAYQHVREEPQPPSTHDPDIPPPVDAVTLKALVKDRNDRYQSAAEMRADVERALAGQPVHAPLAAPVADATTRLAPQGPTRVAPVGIPYDGGAGTYGGGGAYGGGGGGAYGGAPSGPYGGAPGGPYGGAPGGPYDGTPSPYVGARGPYAGAPGPPSTSGPAQSPGYPPGPLPTPSYTPAAPNGPMPRTAGPGGDRRQPGARRRSGLLFWVLLTLVALAVFLLAATVGRNLLGAGGDGQRVTVPRVVGQQLSAARSQLQARDLRVEATAQTSNQPANEVLRQTPSPDTSVAARSVVRLTYSAGPGKVAVPALTGQTLSEARAALARLGLSMRVEESNAPQRAGVVLSSQPATGTSLDRSAGVVLRVATGRNAVPDVVGRQLPDAQARLRDAGFEVSVVQEASAAAAVNAVLRQRPTGDAIRSVGGQVVLVVASTGTAAPSVGTSVTASPGATPSPSQSPPSAEPTPTRSPSPPPPPASGSPRPTPTRTSAAPTSASPSPTETDDDTAPTPSGPGDDGGAAAPGSGTPGSPVSTGE